MISLILVFINLICEAFGAQFAQNGNLLFLAILVEAMVEVLIACAIDIIKTIKDSK